MASLSPAMQSDLIMVLCFIAAAQISTGAVPTSSPDTNTRRAVKALIGDPQAVYLYNAQRFRARFQKGVSLSLDGRYIAKAHLRGQGRTKTKMIGVYDTVEEAARAHDAAVFESSGQISKLNYPEEYFPRM